MKKIYETSEINIAVETSAEFKAARLILETKFQRANWESEAHQHNRCLYVSCGYVYTRICP